MKRIILVLALLFCLQPPPVQAEETIVISTGEWPPWTGEKLLHNGAVLDIVRQAFARQGYDVKYDYYPWQRAFDLMVKGEVHASAYWARRDHYARTCLLSDPVKIENYVFMHLKTNSIRPWKTLSDLEGYRIGATQGVSYTDEFWSHAQRGVYSVEVVQSDEMNVDKLRNGRIDLLPTTPSMMNLLLNRNYPNEKALFTYTKPYHTATGHVLFPKIRQDSAKLMRALNQGLAEISQDGTLGEIMERLEQGSYDKPVDP